MESIQNEYFKILIRMLGFIATAMSVEDVMYFHMAQKQL